MDGGSVDGLGRTVEGETWKAMRAAKAEGKSAKEAREVERRMVRIICVV